MKMAAAGGRVSESSDEISSSSSDDSLLSDVGQLPLKPALKPYMHKPPATQSTLRKGDKSASLNSDSVDERHQHWFVTWP